MNQIRPRLTPEEYSAIKSFRGKRNVGVIGDTHFPFTHTAYLNFCYETFNRFGVTDIVHIGDLVDNHAISYHESDPDGYSPGDEADEAQIHIRMWTDVFPEVKMCIGNHDRLPDRKRQTVGLPQRFIKKFEEAWNLPKGWTVDYSFKIDGVKYIHGTGNSGMYAHINAAIKHMTPLVMGHTHSYAGVDMRASEDKMIWGLGVGCGVDRHSYAAAYGKELPNKPILSCGIVLDNGRVPMLIPMNMD